MSSFYGFRSFPGEGPSTTRKATAMKVKRIIGPAGYTKKDSSVLFRFRFRTPPSHADSPAETIIVKWRTFCVTLLVLLPGIFICPPGAWADTEPPRTIGRSRRDHRGLGRRRMMEALLSVFRLPRTGLLAGALLFAVVFAWEGAGATEQYGMPSEQATREQTYGSGGTTFVQVARVSSLRKHEDRLFVNVEPFVLKSETRFEDERGRRIEMGEIPLGAQIEMHVQRGSYLEDSGYGPDTRILMRMRILQRPEENKPAP